ncbi:MULTISPECIES: DUF397 domain-containing protein [unclassified Streptomyces]|uniref:DUF397 domain-containing protein n=1 Tax=unclassified Streptomyces TaxID=2593676 RepID=UPI00336A59BB
MPSRTSTVDAAPEDAWFKSSYSGQQGGTCVEVANLTTTVGVRDSKDTTRPALLIPPAAWAAFVSGVRTGRL